MNMVERVLIYILLGVALWFAFKKPAPVVQIQRTAPVALPEKVKEKELPADGYKRNVSGEIVEVLPINSMLVSGSVRYWIDGTPVSVGSMTGRGRVEYIDADKAVYKDFDGKLRHVVNGRTPMPSRNFPHNSQASSKPKDGKSS